MIYKEDECVGCPPEMGCLGNACPYKNVIHLACDECGDDVDALYYSNLDDRQLCENCIIKEHKEVRIV